MNLELKSSLVRILSIFKARNLEFFRDRSSLGWAFIFPFLIVVGFSFMHAKDAAVFQIGFVGTMPSDLKEKLNDLKSVEYFESSSTDGLKKLGWQRFDLFLDFTNSTIHFNEKSSKYKILISALRLDQFEQKKVEDNAIRYVDWLFPGIIGMNMMFAALFGIGYVIVRYRKNGVLKRFNATPMTAFEFLTAQLLSRFFIVLFTSSVIYFGCSFVLNLKTDGSFLSVLLIFSVTSLSLMSIGLLIASRVKSEELAGGLLNAMSWPMMFLTGIWFSNENFSPILKSVSQAIPLTQSIEALRHVLLEGKSTSEIMPALTYNLIFALIVMSIAAWLFKWVED